MAKFLKRIPLYFFIAINLAIVMAMIFCAYSQVLPPQRYPNWSYFGMMFPLPLALNVLFVFFWLTFKWRYASLPLVGMLLCAGPIRTFCPFNISKDVPPGCIKVMSYNTYNFGHNAPSTLEGWQQHTIARYIYNSGADIVCLQETTVPHGEIALEWLKEVYPYQEYCNIKGNYMTFLSKHPILSKNYIEYDSETNLSAVCEVQIDSDTVLVINNHLQSYGLQDEDKNQYKDIIKNPDSNGTEQKYETLVSKLAVVNAKRGSQVDSVAAFIDKHKGRYIILCGDFNDASLSYSHHRLTQHLNDAFTRSGNGLGISYNRNGMYFRIDNILCSPNITPYAAVVDNTIAESDHYPISTYLKLEK